MEYNPLAPFAPFAVNIVFDLWFPGLSGVGAGGGMVQVPVFLAFPRSPSMADRMRPVAASRLRV